MPTTRTLVWTRRSQRIRGGFAREGVHITVDDATAERLLEEDGWEEVGGSRRARLTEVPEPERAEPAVRGRKGKGKGK